MNACEWCGTEIAWSGGACSIACADAVKKVMDRHRKGTPLVRIAEAVKLDPAEVDAVIQAASERIHREATGDGFVREWARAVLSYRAYEKNCASIADSDEAPSVRNKASDNQHKALAALDKLFDLLSPEKHIQASLPEIRLEFVEGAAVQSIDEEAA